MASFEDFLAQLKQKKTDENGIPMERPSDESEVLSALQNNMPNMKQPQMASNAHPSEADLAALQSNNESLGIPSLTIPYRNESNSPIPPMGIANGGQLPPAKEMPMEEPSEQQNIVKALQSIGSKSSSKSAPNVAIPSEQMEAPTDLSDKEFLKAQDDTNFNRRLAGLLASGEEIGRGIGGLGAGAVLDSPKSSVVKGLGETSDNPIKDLAAKRKAQKEMLDLMDDKKKNDPKSDVSILYRESMRKLGMNIRDTATASELERAQPAIGTMINKQLSMEANKNRQEELNLTRQIAMSTKTDARDAVNAQRVMAMADKTNLGEETKSLKTISVARDVINTALKQTDPKKKRAMLGPAFMLFAKPSQGDNSVVREGDMKMLSSIPGLNMDLFNKAESYLDGSKGITDDDLKSMLQIVEIIEKRRSIDLNSQYDVIKNRRDTLSPKTKNEELFSQATLDVLDRYNSPDKAVAEKPKGFYTQETLQNYAKKNNISIDAAVNGLKGMGYVLK